MIRKLKLINAKGETWDLNRESSFFHTLSGFGFEDATQYERIGTTFYPLDEILNQGRVDGSVFFSEPDSYGRYREFARFVRVMPLTLVYQMDDVFRLQVRVAKLEKGEKINGGIGLDCPISFIAEGLFYRTVNKYGNTIMIGGKIYDYGYPHTYADESYNTVLIDSDSNKDSPCRITIFGPCLNPQWKRNLMKLGTMCCQADVINYGNLPYTDFKRTKTLCYGDDLCNFEFIRHETDAGDGWERYKSR